MANLGELRKVLVLYTGGTIGMKKNRNGVYAPVPDLFPSKVKTCQELHDPEMARIYCTRDHELITKVTSCNKVIVYQIREYQPLLDSSNMTIKEWILIAKSIEENYHEFDGFVVLSGTDTLAYTSSILSFMFKNLHKPILITGSQVPIFEYPNDAIGNMLSALIFASCYEIPEVCVFFANKLMRGNRVRKIHTSRLDAFDSPNYHILAETGFHTRVYRHWIYPKTERGMLTVFTNLCARVGILYIFPTLTRTQLLSFLEPTLEGVVLMAFGAGNMPSHRKDLLDVLRNAVGRGVTVVLVTQCTKGSVNVSYETGRCMEEIGIIFCHDMTVEAAYAKLVVVCGMTRESEERGEIFDCWDVVSLEYCWWSIDLLLWCCVVLVDLYSLKCFIKKLKLGVTFLGMDFCNGFREWGNSPQVNHWLTRDVETSLSIPSPISSTPTAGFLFILRTELSKFLLTTANDSVNNHNRHAILAELFWKSAQSQLYQAQTNLMKQVFRGEMTLYPNI